MKNSTIHDAITSLRVKQKEAYENAEIMFSEYGMDEPSAWKFEGMGEGFDEAAEFLSQLLKLEEDPPQVYVVTSGIYSSTRIVGIFTAKPVAESVAKRRPDSEVHTYTLNELTTPLTSGLAPDDEVVLMVKDPSRGLLRYDVDGYQSYEGETPMTEDQAIVYADRGGVFTLDGCMATVVTCKWDALYEEPFKIAAEQFAQYEAEEQGLA